MGDFNLSLDDNGRKLKIFLGDRLIINLKQLGGAGYDWEIFDLDQEILENLSHSDTAANSSALGGSGLRTFIFKSKKKGTTRLYLKHRRPWDPEDISIDEFILAIAIE